MNEVSICMSRDIICRKKGHLLSDIVVWEKRVETERMERGKRVFPDKKDSLLVIADPTPDPFPDSWGKEVCRMLYKVTGRRK